MYTSTYSSSPVRTFTSDLGSTNQQQQSFDRQQYPQPSTNSHFTSHQTMDEGNLSSRRMPTGGYSNSPSASIPIRTTTPSRKYASNSNNAANDPASNRYPPTGYSSSYRAYGDGVGHRTSNGSRFEGVSGNDRAHSYDDLLNEQNRAQSSIYHSNTRIGGGSSHPNYVQQPQHVRREPYNDHDDDLVVKSTDLSATNEQEMLDLVRSAFRKYDLGNQRELAGFLKRSADKAFSSCWHCIVGRQFSSYVTHEMNGFIYLTKGPLSILLFKSGS